MQTRPQQAAFGHIARRKPTDQRHERYRRMPGGQPFSGQNGAFSAGGRAVLGPERFVLRPCLTLLRPEQSVLHAEQPVPRPWPTVLPAERVIPRPRQDEPPRSKADMSKTKKRNSFQIFSLTAAPHHRNSGSLASSPQKGAKGAQANRR